MFVIHFCTISYLYGMELHGKFRFEVKTSKKDRKRKNFVCFLCKFSSYFLTFGSSRFKGVKQMFVLAIICYDVKNFAISDIKC